MKKIFYATLSLLTILFSTAKSQTIFSEDFEGTSGSSLPASWSQSTLSTDGGWLSGTGTGLSSTSFGIPNHTRILATNDDGCNCNKSADFLKSPAFDLLGYTTVYLSFDAFWFAGTYQGATESADLMGSVDGGTTWFNIGQISEIGRAHV